MTEYTNHQPWNTETPSHKISHNKHHEKWCTTDKIKHNPSMLRTRIKQTQITTDLLIATFQPDAKRVLDRVVEC